MIDRDIIRPLEFSGESLEKLEDFDINNLEVGMVIINNDDEQGYLHIAWIGDDRDGSIVALDDCGHSVLLHKWRIEQENYSVYTNGTLKFRVIYGKSFEGELHVSTDYYKDIDEFKKKINHNGYAGLLGVTGKWCYD